MVVRHGSGGYDSNHRLPANEPPPGGPMTRKHTLSFSCTRRRFLRQAAATGAALLAAPAVLSARSPNEKLNLVIIGCGGRGAANMKEMLQENIVALCDVSEPNLLKAAEKAPKA